LTRVEHEISSKGIQFVWEWQENVRRLGEIGGMFLFIMEIKGKKNCGDIKSI
jgi:hypothetical protein